MEQKVHRASTPQPSHLHNRRDTTEPTSPVDTDITPIVDQDPLSTFELSLRFPVPVGSSHLAHWISSSDPDIMRTTTVSAPRGPHGEASLEDSTYELVHTDSEWSQDGALTDASETDSVDLNYRTIDDTQSVDGESEDYVSTEAEAVQGFGASIETIKPTYADVAKLGEDSAADESAIEFLSESLDAPSMPSTPKLEGQKYSDNNEKGLRPDDGSEFQLRQKAIKEKIIAAKNWVRDTFMRLHDMRNPNPIVHVVVAFVWGALLVVNGWFIFGLLSSLGPSASSLNAVTTAVSTIGTTSSALTTSTKQITQLSSSTVNGVQCIPLSTASSDEWSFLTDPEVKFSPYSENSVLIEVPTTLIKGKRQQCVKINATRGGQSLPISTTFEAKRPRGLIVVEFDHRHAHGLVEVNFQYTCRHKFNKAVAITYHKGIMKEIYDITKHLAMDFADFVPAKAQEAERRLGNATRSWGNSFAATAPSMNNFASTLISSFSGAANNTASTMQTASINIVARMGGATGALADTVGNLSSGLVKQMGKHANSVRDTQDQLSIHLLDAQISARVLYLKALGRKDYHDYQRKGRELLAQKSAAARLASRARHGHELPKGFHATGAALWAKFSRLPYQDASTDLRKIQRLT